MFRADLAASGVSQPLRDRAVASAAHTGTVITEPAASGYAGAPTGRAKGRAVGLVVVVAACLGLFLWWASSQGFIALGGTGCSDEGYPDPMPSYAELVEDHGKSPYCARHARGETWF